MKLAAVVTLTSSQSRGYIISLYLISVIRFFPAPVGSQSLWLFAGIWPWHCCWPGQLYSCVWSRESSHLERLVNFHKPMLYYTYRTYLMNVCVLVNTFRENSHIELGMGCISDLISRLKNHFLQIDCHIWLKNIECWANCSNTALSNLVSVPHPVWSFKIVPKNITEEYPYRLGVLDLPCIRVRHKTLADVSPPWSM